MVRELKLESAVPLRGRRVYLGRKTTPNRPYNQDELIAESKRFGYEPVFLEDLSFRDSVKVMMEAESVIGPHGAGWANALFCHPGTSGVMWTWRDSMRDNWFANVASIAGMNFQCLFTEESDSQKYNLSPHLLRLTLEQVRTHPFGEGLGKSREIANC
jgi:capsular polysaccharide biosynthesis protein